MGLYSESFSNRLASSQPAEVRSSAWVSSTAQFSTLEPAANDLQRSKPATNVKAGNNPGVVLVDSPNASRTAAFVYGRRARPDWAAILQLVARIGRPVSGIVVVNDGLPEHFIRKFRDVGYAVQFSHARDVDDRVVAQAIRMVDRARVFAIVSGDGGYCSLAAVLRRLHKRVIVIAVEARCHPKLRKLAHEFHQLPIVSVSGPGAAGAQIASAQPENRLTLVELDHTQDHCCGSDWGLV
jgi:uncharacterized LabA/DUF88 family protein